MWLRSTTQTTSTHRANECRSSPMQREAQRGDGEDPLLGLRKRQTRSRRKLVKYPHSSENVGGQGRRKWSQHDSRMDEGRCQRCEAVMGFRTSCTIGIPPGHIAKAVRVACHQIYSDIRSASGAFLVTGGYSPFVGRCCFWAVPDSVRRRNTGRHSSGTTFAHYRVA